MNLKQERLFWGWGMLEPESLLYFRVVVLFHNLKHIFAKYFQIFCSSWTNQHDWILHFKHGVLRETFFSPWFSSPCLRASHGSRRRPFLPSSRHSSGSWYQIKLYWIVLIKQWKTLIYNPLTGSIDKGQWGPALKDSDDQGLAGLFKVELVGDACNSFNSFPVALLLRLLLIVRTEAVTSKT